MNNVWIINLVAALACLFVALDSYIHSYQGTNWAAWFFIPNAICAYIGFRRGQR